MTEYIKRESESGIKKLYKQQDDGYIPVVEAVITGAGADLELSTTRWIANEGGDGYSVGDNISQIDIIDASDGSISSTIWRNGTTRATISAPNSSHLVLAEQTDGLTLAQAQSIGLSLASKQDEAKDLLTDIKALSTTLNSLTDADAKVVLNGQKLDDINTKLDTIISIISLKYAGHQENSEGQIISESESNGVITRTRTWSHSTVGGITTHSTSDWSLS